MDHFSYSWWYIRLLKRGKIEKDKAKKIIMTLIILYPLVICTVAGFLVALALFITAFTVFQTLIQ